MVPHIILLLRHTRKLLPLDSASVNRGSVTVSKERDAPSVSKSKSENMDVDVSCESSHSRGECQDTGDGIEHSGVSVCEDVWEECGCVLWDLAASKTHAELMVENLILEVLLANLIVCKSVRVTEIIIGIIGNLACHEVPMKHIVSTKGLIEIIVDKLFMEDPQCLCETCRLLTVGLQSGESIKWAEALQSEQILCQILWIAENTLNLQLLEKCVGLILAILESQQIILDDLLPSMMKLGLASILINLLTFEISKLKNDRTPERYSILDLILRAIEGLSVIDEHSQEICSNKELFHLLCDLVKFPDKVEVGNCCVTAAVLIANILSDVPDCVSEISQDWRLLGGLLDIFPFASDDLEARNAVWNVLVRILVRIHETEMNSSSLCQFVSVLVRRIDLIEDELLNQQCVDSSPVSTTDARNTSLMRITSIVNQWTTVKEDAENNGNAEVLFNETDLKKLLDCCHKFSK
ncbi:protein saal1-like isoform X3 [Trifolium pratense]|uniref:protein saal1-like isoform X3 n=1 Tax=Trifolium pratense TaxID=57577 RepID=UPI001E697F20|nr:protein saal1-like isoform X3 [Trifolium pratense]XP_045805563.1 protein saal1-like isoform X3 [Trifolium pratense]